jgi:hypothetical protein
MIETLPFQWLTQQVTLPLYALFMLLLLNAPYAAKLVKEQIEKRTETAK